MGGAADCANIRRLAASAGNAVKACLRVIDFVMSLLAVVYHTPRFDSL
jgi:hypothetical protein